MALLAGISDLMSFGSRIVHHQRALGQDSLRMDLASNNPNGGPRSGVLLQALSLENLHHLFVRGASNGAQMD